jgi:hypothetical protein
LQEGSAPAAAGTGTKTLCQLPDAPRLLDTDEINDLAFGHVKTEAQFVIKIHEFLFALSRPNGQNGALTDPANG